MAFDAIKPVTLVIFAPSCH